MKPAPPARSTATGGIASGIDDEQVVDLPTKDRKITIRYGAIENSLPLGIAAYQTRTAVRGIRLRRL